MRNLFVLALVLPLVACGPSTPSTAATTARVFFVAPADSAVVADTLFLQLGAEGVTIAAANGQRVDGEAHHHLFIDSDPTPDSVMIGRDSVTRHLGTGADTLSLVLAPGMHRIIAVAAWGDHFPVVGAGRDTLFVEVRAPNIMP